MSRAITSKTLDLPTPLGPAMQVKGPRRTSMSRFLNPRAVIRVSTQRKVPRGSAPTSRRAPGMGTGTKGTLGARTRRLRRSLARPAVGAGRLRRSPREAGYGPPRLRRSLRGTGRGPGKAPPEPPRDRWRCGEGSAGACRRPMAVRGRLRRSLRETDRGAGKAPPELPKTDGGAGRAPREPPLSGPGWRSPPVHRHSPPRSATAVAL